MKILHTCESYWPAICGVQEVVQRVSEELAARGHEVTVATSYNAQRDVKKINDVTIEQFNSIGISFF